MQIDNYLKYLQYEKGVSPHTLTAYKNDLHQFQDFVTTDAGRFVLKNLDSSDVRRWILSMMSTKISPNSIARKVSALNSFFKYCLKHKTLKVNPAEGVVIPKKGKHLPSFLKKDEIEALFAQEESTDDFASLRDDLILEMLIGLGLRRAELINIKDQDIDFANKVIKVLGKRNKERIIPAYRRILDKSKIYMEVRDQSFPNASQSFFLTNKGKPIYDKFVYLLVKQCIGDVSTLDKRSPHVLRHSYATLLLNEGADIEVLRELLGHSSLASTQVYTHSTFEQLRKSYAKAHPRERDENS